MDSLKMQTIEHYAKLLRTPTFNQYPDVIRQLEHDKSYEDF